MTWPTVRLGDLAEQVRGVSFAKADSTPMSRSGYLPVLTASNLTDDGIVMTPLQFVPSVMVQQKQLLRKFDIVVTASSGSLSVVGRAAMVKSDLNAGFGAFCKVIRSSDRVDANYLAHFMRTPEYRREVSRLAAGANINNLKNEDLDGLAIPLPSLPEQRRIASILDHAEALRASRRAAVEATTSIEVACFEDRFSADKVRAAGWRVGTIRDLLVSASYGSSGKAGEKGEYPILRMGNLTSTGEIVTDSLKYIDLPKTEREKYLVSAGDVLFNRTNSPELVGKSAVFRGHEPVAYAGYLVRLRTNELCDPEYLGAFLNSARAKATLRGMAKSIVGMANINAQEVQNMVIPIPPIAEQRSFAEEIAQVEKLKTILRDHLAKLDELFESVQHLAFSDQL